MDSDETFNWSDGDVILRCTHGSDSRDFRLHKLFLSFASPVFKDMFKLSQPSSVAASDIDVVDVIDPPTILELLLRFIYPCPPPVIDNLALLTEVLVLADKYDVEAARARLRPSLAEFAKTEPLRVYAIACRLGLEEEKKTASSYTTSIDLSTLAQLPDEFKSVSAMEYQRLIRLHARYRKEVIGIATRAVASIPSALGGAGFYNAVTGGRGAVGSAAHSPIVDCVAKCTPLDYQVFALTLKKDYAIDPNSYGHVIRSIIDQAKALRLTV